MILFDTVRKSLALSFYAPNQTRIFDKRRVLFGSIVFLSIISFFVFIFVDAHNISEYVMSAYFLTAVTGIFCSFIDTSTKTAIIFKLIDCEFPQIIEKSMFVISL